MPAHIPPGKEDLYRRQAEADAEVERTGAWLEAMNLRQKGLAREFEPGDPAIDDILEEEDRACTAYTRAVAIADRVYQERMAGLSAWIDHDPTAPVCTACKGAGGPPGSDAHGACKRCRGWGRESRPPIPVWNERGQEWVNPATGQTVDLLADYEAEAQRQADHRRRHNEWLDAEYEKTRAHKRAQNSQYDGKPITTTSTESSGGTGMSGSIEEVRAGIMAANEKANEGLGAVQHAHACLEEAQAQLMHATEGSGQGDVSDANGLLAQAINDLDTVRQQVAAAISAAEGVGNRL